MLQLFKKLCRNGRINEKRIYDANGNKSAEVAVLSPSQKLKCSLEYESKMKRKGLHLLSEIHNFNSVLISFGTGSLVGALNTIELPRWIYCLINFCILILKFV